jgi:hypothetical protein
MTAATTFVQRRMKSAFQTHFDLRADDGQALTFALPMNGIVGIRAVTGMNEDEILSACLPPDRKIRWAFNLAAEADGKIFLRVWNRSLVCYISPALPQPDRIEKVCDAILPAQSKQRGTLLGTELQRSFNVGSEHVLNLLRANLIREHGGSDWRPGRGGSPLIVRSSVEDFLKERRIV